MTDGNPADRMTMIGKVCTFCGTTYLPCYCTRYE